MADNNEPWMLVDEDQDDGDRGAVLTRNARVRENAR